MELPIGKNCRYYFNGSTLISNAPSSSYTESRNILDCKTIGTSFEIYDAVLINNDGTYCVHDEANKSKTPYHHLYKNIKMTYNGTIQHDSGMRCIGCGVGYNGEIILEGCDFYLEGTATDAFAVHGPTDNSQSAEQLNLRICISNCFTNKCNIISISDYYFVSEKDDVYLRIANCNALLDISSETTGIASTLIKFNNSIGG